MLKGAYKVVTHFLPTLLIAVFLVSCAHTPNVAGKWQEPEKTSTIEFGQDGTFTATDDMGMTVRGNYILQVNGKIRLEIKHPNSSVEIIIGSIEVQGNELILTFDEGKEVLKYKKVQ